MRIVLIDCTEKHHDKITNVASFLSNCFNTLNVENLTIKLSKLHIVKCTKCRVCSQKRGRDPSKCFVKDEMNDVIDEIENSDACVILSDTNSLFRQNKIFTNFAKRLIAYHYWPYGQSKAKARKSSLERKSILINYNTTKYFMNHSFYTSKKSLEDTAKIIGAKVVAGMPMVPHKEELTEVYKEKLEIMANKLINSLK